MSEAIVKFLVVIASIIGGVITLTAFIKSVKLNKEQRNYPLHDWSDIDKKEDKE